MRSKTQLLKLMGKFHLWIVFGVFFSAGILFGTNLLLEREKAQVLKEEKAHGNLLAKMVESHLTRTLSSIDNTFNVLHGVLLGHTATAFAQASNADIRSILEGATINSTHLRSVSVLMSDGRVIASSTKATEGKSIDLRQLGFDREFNKLLEPGQAVFVRDINELNSQADHPPDSQTARQETPVEHTPAGNYSLPFAKQIEVNGKRLILLAMVNPYYLLSDYQGMLGADANFATLMNFRGKVLATTLTPYFSVGKNYSNLALFDALNNDQDFGQLPLTFSGENQAAETYLISFRAPHQFPVVAVVGISETQALSQWKNSASTLKWTGVAVAFFVLLCAVLLNWFMHIRDRFDEQLEIEKINAEQANSAKSAFLSTMSHEIRTPMNGVIGMTGLLLETQLNARQQEFARTIDESATALMSIINDMLDFSKIEAGKMRIENTDCQLLSIVEGSCEILMEKAGKKQLKLMSYVGPELPTTVSTDPGRLRQILLNLLGNAVKFTAHGEISLDVKAVSKTRDIYLVRFEVSDSGIGIDAPTSARLFMPFVQADSSVTRRYGGTGLGLSISKRLVELMGGRIGVDSTPGKGSCFWFEIPMRAMGSTTGSGVGSPLAERAESSAGTTAISAAEMNPYPSADLQVLVVDASRKQADILAQYLQAWGMQVTVAGSAREAVQLFNGIRHFHIVIIDNQLSDSTPDVLARSLSMVAPNVRFILLSNSEETRADSRLRVFHADLRQPVKQSSLFDAITHVCERRQREIPVPSERRKETIPLRTNPENTRSELILLVEDNLINQKVLRTLLEKLGFQTDVVNNGQEALDALQRQPYALVLMDCQMPVMDGFAATRRIRAGETLSGQHIPIVAVTANAMQGDRDQCLAAGMDAYLSKPVMRAALVQVLAEQLAHYPAAAVLPSSALARSLADGLTPARASPVSNLLDSAMLDLSRLQDMFGDDHAMQMEILDSFIATTAPLLDTLAQVMKQGDFTAVHAIGHQIRGSCANLGVAELAGLASELEQAARLQNPARIQQLHSAMLVAFERLRSYVRLDGVKQ